ncbi:MAG: tRNA pseudouridine(13) synthase TruD [Pseudomonadales bacterium]
MAFDASLKVEPGDFRVDESLPFEPTGEGEHLLVRLEKTGIGTPELARLLADAHGMDHQDVGYAGMKDKRAVTTQWFSLRGVTALDEAVATLDGIRVLEVTRHRQKLRRGQVGGNAFHVLLRDVPAPRGQGGDGDLTDALQTLAARGAPNYFGGQRFGWDNLDRATRWLSRRRRVRVSAFKQGLYLSVLRSYLFNEVLAARVNDGTWNTLVAGDVQDGRVLPTGPLWGRGRNAVTDAAAEVERLALAPHAALLDGLEHAGLTQARRPLVVIPQDFTWHRQDDRLELRFTLGAGEYATSLLGDVFELHEPGAGDPDAGGFEADEPGEAVA